MHQLILIIPSSVDLNLLDQNWSSFLAEAERMPGLIKESVTRVDQSLFGEVAISRIYTFSFPDQETLENSLLSEPGEKAGQLIHALTNGQVLIMTGKTLEDSINNIQSHKNPNPNQ